MGSHAVCMATFGLRQNSRRLAAVDGYQFPGSVRQRFVQQHGELTDEGIRSVEAAARQWFRIGVRHPRVRLTMPSVIVGALWREFVVQTREYAEFCDATLGRSPHLPPEPPGTADGAARKRSDGLRATFRFAQEDEPGRPGSLPVLFRVDWELKVAGGRHYLADCGGRGTCHELKGTVCLQHLAGPGKAVGGGTWDLKRTSHDGWGASGGGGSCGGGCGGCGGP